MGIAGGMWIPRCESCILFIYPVRVRSAYDIFCLRPPRLRLLLPSAAVKCLCPIASLNNRRSRITAKGLTNLGLANLFASTGKPLCGFPYFSS